MKRILTVVLALCLCISFAGCSTVEEEKVMKTDIVGEWMAVSINACATFNEDGTGVLEYNGKHSLTWKYDPDTDRYNVTADQSYQAYVGKEYDMPYMNMMGADFYSFDDYDKAFTLMISRRCEDIVELTIDMTKIELFMPYELADSVSLYITDISNVENENGDGLVISYAICNESDAEISQGMTAVVNARYYLADHADAVTKAQDLILAESIASADMISDTIEFSIGEDAQPTLDAHGMLIGALYFEIAGQNYYIDLSEWVK